MQYDVIIDIAGRNIPKGSMKCLKPGGRYVFVNFSFSVLLQALWVSLTSDKRILTEVVGYRVEDMNYLAELVESGQIKSVIDREYALEDIVEAHRYVDTGKKIGHVVVRVEH
jgi:NADPH:quinone reductase-like Zn-dependent oxidoreductase